MTGEIAKSAAILADLRPALLCPLPSAWDGPSLLARFAGLFDTPFAVGGLDGCRTPFGGRFVDIDGDGDDFEDTTPLVWMPGGAGRLILDATGGG